ncbi:MAG: putative Ig domain-containing protein [Ignavibacteriae bacterium]|nr:putative Ig domain-containing protein [Ignavibacteriota bacterium]
MKHYFLFLLAILCCTLFTNYTLSAENTTAVNPSRTLGVGFYTSDNVPPNGRYETPLGYPPVLYAGGAIHINNLLHQTFSASVPPPPLGQIVTHSFASGVNLEMSFDGGSTFAPQYTSSMMTMRFNHTHDTGAVRFFSLEVLQDDIAGGTLPAGVLIRESPTLASNGTMAIQTVTGGFHIESFFDIFLEVSMDGGQSWNPGNTFHHQELVANCNLDITPQYLRDAAVNQPYSETLTGSGGVAPYIFQVSNGLLPDGIVLSGEGIFSGTPTKIGTWNFNITVTDSFGCTFTDGFAISVYPPEYFIATDNFPPNGKYIGQNQPIVMWANGVQLRELVHRNLYNWSSPPPVSSNQYYSFNGALDYELSMDGGLTWQIGHSSSVNNVVLDYGRSDAGTTWYEGLALQMDVLLGGSIMIRESPTWNSRVQFRTDSVSGGYMVSSFFDVFLELSVDGGASWQPASNSMPLEMGYPTEYDFMTNLYPPLTGEFASKTGSVVVFNNGIQFRDLIHKRFTQGVSLTDGTTQTNSFGAEMVYEVSYDGGSTWASGTSPTSDAVRIAHRSNDGDGHFFDTEMLSLNISGGSLPGGVMLRESPTFASTGSTNGRTITGGYMISSFFDIFFELSVDGGQSWLPAQNYIVLELKAGCPTIILSPTTLQYGVRDEDYAAILTASGGASPYIFAVSNGELPDGVTLLSDGTLSGTPTINGDWTFTVTATDANDCTGERTYSFEVFPFAYPFAVNYVPPDGQYISKEDERIIFVNGMAMKNIVQSDLMPSIPPPEFGGMSHAYSGRTSFQFSFDGGFTFFPYIAPTNFTEYISISSASGETKFYDTEMLQMDIAGGSLPPGVMFRESPTLASLGKTKIETLPSGNFLISSFFDVFTEVSIDGGMTWVPALNNIQLELFKDCISLICPNDYNLTTTNLGGLIVNYSPPSVSNDCSGTSVIVSAVPPSGSLFPLGTTVVTVVASNEYESDTCTFNVTISFGPEIDHFPKTVAQITLQYPDQSTETISLIGPTTVEVNVTPTGGASDSDGDGRDEVTTEIVSLDLRGNSSMGWVKVGLDPIHPTVGLIEETANNTPGTLDISPFRPLGTAESFFDVFFEIEVGGMKLYGSQAATMRAIITHKPPALAETYTNLQGQPPIMLVDSFGNPSGITMISEIHIPNPYIETDVFTVSVGQLFLDLPGGTELVNLTGTVTIDAFISPAGAAQDRDNDGLDQVYAQISQVNLLGGSSLGLVHVNLNSACPSLGQIEENANNNPGILDVPPFAISGNAKSFFDVFLDIRLPEFSLTESWQNKDSLYIWETITYKPVAAGETFRRLPQQLPVLLYQSSDGSLSEFSVSEFLLIPEANITQTLTTEAGWNMVSVPLTVADYTKTSLYPTALSDAFAYEGGYVTKSVLENGVGYWMKFIRAEYIYMNGSFLLMDSIDVTQGWNMVGSISSPVLASDILSVPRGIITSQFWGFNIAQGYVASDSILPGKAYWVKVNQNGQLILSSEILSCMNRIVIVPTSELPPPPPEGDGNSNNSVISSEYALEQNYPNPFNPLTVIRYQLPVDTWVTLKVFNTLGEEVATLVDELQSSGYRFVEWDATNIPGGMYFYRLTADSYSKTKKLILLK